MEEPRLVAREAFTVVGMRRRGTNANVSNEVPPMWGRLMERAGEIRGIVNRREAYGVIGNWDRTTGEFDYVAGFEVTDASAAPEGMVSWRVPPQTYAVFPCTLATLMETFRHICDVWFPESGRGRGSGPEFELYGEEFDPADANSMMYVYVPVE